MELSYHAFWRILKPTGRLLMFTPLSHWGKHGKTISTRLLNASETMSLGHWSLYIFHGLLLVKPLTRCLNGNHLVWSLMIFDDVWWRLMVFADVRCLFDSHLFSKHVWIHFQPDFRAMEFLDAEAQCEPSDRPDLWRSLAEVEETCRFAVTEVETKYGLSFATL